METQFYPEQTQHLARICDYLSGLLGCAVQTPKATAGGFLVGEMDLSSFAQDVLFERTDARISPRVPLVFSGWHVFETDEVRALNTALRRFNPMQTIALLVLFDEARVVSAIQQTVPAKHSQHRDFVGWQNPDVL